jgi:hypothetical protein
MTNAIFTGLMLGACMYIAMGSRCNMAWRAS